MLETSDITHDVITTACGGCGGQVGRYLRRHDSAVGAGFVDHVLDAIVGVDASIVGWHLLVVEEADAGDFKVIGGCSGRRLVALD